MSPPNESNTLFSLSLDGEGRERVTPGSLGATLLNPLLEGEETIFDSKVDP
jgi:hypothetical protein